MVRWLFTQNQLVPQFDVDERRLRLTSLLRVRLSSSENTIVFLVLFSGLFLSGNLIRNRDGRLNLLCRQFNKSSRVKGDDTNEIVHWLCKQTEKEFNKGRRVTHR